MKHGEDDVDRGTRGGIGGRGRQGKAWAVREVLGAGLDLSLGVALEEEGRILYRQPPASLGNAEFDHGVARAVDGLHDRTRRAKRDLVFAAFATKENTYPKLPGGSRGRAGQREGGRHAETSFRHAATPEGWMNLEGYVLCCPFGGETFV